MTALRMRNAHLAFIAMGTWATAFAALPATAAAEQQPGSTSESVARVLSVQGQALLASAAAGTATSARIPLSRGTRLYAHDQIQTEANTAVRLLLKDRSIIDIGASSSVNIGEVMVAKGRRSVSLRLAVGRIWARVSSFFGGRSDFEIVTPTAVAGVRGTEFVADVDLEARSKFIVVHGRVEMRSLNGELREAIGPMMSGLFAGSGQIVLEPVDPAVLEAMAAEIQPRPSLDDDELEQLDAIDAELGARQPLAPARPSMLDQPTPPLESEPGAGRAAVRGQLEIRE